jgi:hypothetical protein
MNRVLTSKDVELEFERIYKCAKSPQVRGKLEKVHSKLKMLNSAGIKPTITVLVKHLIQDGVKISGRAFYNQREDGNLYRKLYDAWAEHGAVPKKILGPVSKGDTLSSTASIIEPDDLTKISDQVLRYRVSIMLGELKGLRQQVNILRHAATATQVIPATDRSIEGVEAQQLLLGEYDIELLEDLLGNQLNFDFNEVGALTAKSSIKRGTTLSKPGLKEAVEKILKSYEMPLLGGD